MKMETEETRWRGHPQNTLWVCVKVGMKKSGQSSHLYVQRTHPNHFNLPLLITNLTGSNPNNSLLLMLQITVKMKEAKTLAVAVIVAKL